MTEDMLYNGAGLLGAIITLAAYFLLETGRINPHRPLYPLFNLLGALLLIVSLLRFWNLASFLINVFWVAISLYGLMRSCGNSTKPRI